MYHLIQENSSFQNVFLPHLFNQFPTSVRYSRAVRRDFWLWDDLSDQRQKRPLDDLISPANLPKITLRCGRNDLAELRGLVFSKKRV